MGHVTAKQRAARKREADRKPSPSTDTVECDSHSKRQKRLSYPELLLLCEQQEKDNTSLTAQVAAHEHNADQLDGHISDLESQLAHEHNTADQLHGNISDLESQLAHEHYTADQLHGNISDLESQLAASKEEHELEVGHLQTQLTARKEAHRLEVRDLQAQLAACRGEHQLEANQLRQQMHDETAARQHLVQEQLVAVGFTENSRKKLKCITCTGLHTLKLANKLGGILHLVRSYHSAKLSKHAQPVVLRRTTVQGSKAFAVKHILQRQRLQRRNPVTYKKV
jgi:uncharacterized coiled-coil protein SlyX